jgi:NitT/TauT family transport system permease protein
MSEGASTTRNRTQGATARSANQGLANIMRKRFVPFVLPLLWGAIVLIVWERFVIWKKVQRGILPQPTSIWRQFLVIRKGILKTALVTGTNAFIGLLIGLLVGVLVAFVAQRFPIVKGMLAPISAAMNTMPIVALGPVFYNLFGTTSDVGRRFVVAMVAFFPIFVNTLRGLTQVDPVHKELMRSYAAGDSDILRYVRIPNALPFMLTGIRIAASLAVIAAVVVEYFGGLQNGLGHRISTAAQGDTTAAFAYIVGACALGLTFYVVALVLERLVMPWQAKRKASVNA